MQSPTIVDLLLTYTVTQVFIDTLVAQRPQLDKTRKGLKHVNNTINLRNEEKGQAH